MEHKVPIGVNSIGLKPMRYSNLEHFKVEIREIDPRTLIENWLMDGNPCAFSTSEDLHKFTQKIKFDYPNAGNIFIVGTSNWQYSLNPNKGFSEFHEKSDIDVAIISPSDFNETWTTLRALHRNKWHSWDKSLRENVLRTGQNVYCGFISPKYIPDRSNDYRFEFLKRCNSYSTSSIGYRDVNMMFFKCIEDVIDYYIRGIRYARSRV